MQVKYSCLYYSDINYWFLSTPIDLAQILSYTCNIRILNVIEAAMFYNIRRNKFYLKMVFPKELRFALTKKWISLDEWYSLNLSSYGSSTSWNKKDEHSLLIYVVVYYYHFVRYIWLVDNGYIYLICLALTQATH